VYRSTLRFWLFWTAKRSIIETTTQSAQGSSDGKFRNGLVSDAVVSNLYGTTNLGGASGVGTVFELTP
jgi:uncharacterized repeat protein (TIGR03803 family)